MNKKMETKRVEQTPELNAYFNRIVRYVFEAEHNVDEKFRTALRKVQIISGDERSQEAVTKACDEYVQAVVDEIFKLPLVEY